MAAKRQTVIALTTLATLSVAIGVLAAINTGVPHPDVVKAELQAKMAELDQIEEPFAKEKFAKELLENEVYKQYAKALYNKVERAYPKIREAANLERAAQKEVPNFMAKCRDLRRVPPEELDALHGEACSLLRTYGTTRHGEELRAVVQELKERCDTLIRCGAPDIPPLYRDVHLQLKDGHFAQAWALIVAFERKYVNAADYESQLVPIRGVVLRRAETDVTKLLADGRTSADAGKKALERLEGLDFKGLPLPAREAAVREFKRR